TIIGCVFDDNHADDGGGALALLLSASALSDCQFVDNSSSAGAGAIAISAGLPTITGCSFTGNSCTADGGAIRIYNSSAAEIVDCQFVSNTASPILQGKGGALKVEGSSPVVEGSTFDSNLASNGAAAEIAGDATCTFTSCTFEDNTASFGTGGAIRCLGGGFDVLGCNFTGNVASWGGGALSCVDAAVTITWSGFTGNQATAGPGGAVLVQGGSLSVGLASFVDNESDGHGGAIFSNDTALELEGAVFSGNDATGDGHGGGASVLDGTVVATQCTFSGNTATVGGGGMFIQSATPSTIQGCTFENNDSFNGGGMRCETGGVAVDECIFEGNHAENVGGGMGASHGSFVRVTACQFLQNVCDGGGGGLGCSASTKVIGSLFEGNSAVWGGGVASMSGQGNPTVMSCLFEGNQATLGGSALSASAGGYATMINCIATSNTSPFNGGTLRSGDFGDGLEVVNCAVVDNDGGGILVLEPEVPVVVSNTILWGNDSGAELIGEPPTVRYSNVEGGAAGTGNIDQDPQFVNAAVGNFALSPGSPCIDGGANWAVLPDTLDIDDDGDTGELVPLDFGGLSRFANVLAADDDGCGGDVTVDIGPHEAAGPSVDGLTPGDVNGDGVIDVGDLLDLILGWGPCDAQCCPADFDMNGFVDVEDLLVLILNWT
ncbi:MAG: right-handed parallel beta-helix repeat-containing protein, partial [Planctomycetota bacterium]